MRLLSRGAATIAALSLAPLLAVVPADAATFPTPGPTWTRTLPGAPVYESSPALADLGATGSLDIVVGAWDGKVYALHPDGSTVAGWPQATTNQINSSPTAADVDGDGRPEIFVGSGTAQQASGALYSFSADGTLRWRDGAPEPDYPGGAAIHASPALSDLDTDGDLDVAVGALGVWSAREVDTEGRARPAFPYLWGDTVFASPAVADVDRNGTLETIWAGDSSPGPVWHQGGAVRALNANGSVRWEHRTDDIVRSSPSVGDIDGDGRLEVVFGGGDYWGGADSVKVWALDADTGAVKWWRETDGVPLGSPALADLDGDGDLDVAVGTWVSHHDRGDGGSVYAFDGHDGHDLGGYPVASGGGGVQGSIVTVDIDGNGAQDLVVTTGPFITILDGRTAEVKMRLGVNLGVGWGNSVAIADIDGNGRLDVVGAGPTAKGDGMVVRWELPATARLGSLGWHQFRKDSRRTGSWSSGIADAGTLGFQRRSGNDRFATAAQASAGTGSGVGTVYVATGENFADALGAGAVAAKDGTSLLLVQPDVLPAATATRLLELRPRQIVVLGAAGAVSDAVLAQLDALAPAVRVAGADRAETAAALSARSFPSGVAAAYLVTGGDFPDGLAASVAAGRAKAPVLLAMGGQLSRATVAELQRLRPASIVVVGGTNALPASTEVQLRGLTSGAVTRVAGSDRYSTAAAVSGLGFGAASTAYVATGRNFPDALTGGAAAAQAGAPLLLVPGSCLPATTRAELDRLGVTRLVLLGGTLAVPSSVASLNPC
jgi:putative cell wall-binding protein